MKQYLLIAMWSIAMPSMAQVVQIPTVIHVLWH